MRVIESTRRPVEKEGFQRITQRINKIMPFGKTDEHAEDALVARFMRGLDNRFTMVRSLPIDGTDECFPPILVGPMGLVLLYMSPLQGSFRAREDSWWEMSATTHNYNPGRPNLIKQSQMYAQKLAAILDRRQKAHPEVIPVLVFSHPGVQIESTNPSIRIVLMDGVESLIGSILKSDTILNPGEVNNLSDTFDVMGNPEKAIPMGEGEDFFGRDLLVVDKKPAFRLPKFKLPTKLSISPVDEKIKFSPRQWLIIEILMILVILILIAGIVYILLVY